MKRPRRVVRVRWRVALILAIALAAVIAPFGTSNAAYTSRTTARASAQAFVIPAVTSQATWWLDASVASTLYSDSACTTQASSSVDAPIGCWRDRRAGTQVLTVPSGSGSPQVGQPLKAKASVNFKLTDRLLGPDLFGGSTNHVTIFLVTRENAASNNMLLNLNGLNTGGTRFSLHSPWGSNRTYYFDAGNATSERVTSSASLVAVGQPALVVAWKDPVAATNGLRINRQQFTSTLSVAGTTTGGLGLGDLLTMAGHDIMELLVFGTTLTATDRAAVENYLSNKWGVAP